MVGCSRASLGSAGWVGWVYHHRPALLLLLLLGVVAEGSMTQSTLLSFWRERPHVNEIRIATVVELVDLNPHVVQASDTFDG